ncbi:MAG: hypothetical protein HN742_16105 [Lentisphaerae bacterium]|jgi:hypothetical protein|nr:hypothetical protein [Lentisphaerota bacterium]MBT5604813.1 hypothetical protein [Lentisphaerota bacterium]MBT7053564.1 hypothetical protein [Lentisphaerota bacterium]MBT7843401.1 hypothetical protein [Lentisphaerota bacterium]
MGISLDEQSGHFSFEHNGVLIGPWSASVIVNGQTHTASAAIQTSASEAILQFADIGLLWSFTARERDGGETLELWSILQNTSETALSLGLVRPFALAGEVDLWDPSATVVQPLPGVIKQRAVHRLADPECPRDSKIKAQFYNSVSRRALQVGFVTFCRADTVVAHTADEAGRLLSLEASCDYAGWELGGGEMTEIEAFTLSLGTCPYAQLESWADRAAERCAPRTWEDVPLGWLGWSWVDAFNVENYEATLLRNCRAMRERLGGHDLRYVWVSIGNLAGGTPGDWLSWNYENFPSGPEGLAAKLNELGFRLGLWCGPFYICSALEDTVEELGDALLERDGELMVVRPEWSYGDHGRLPKAKRPCIYALDPSHPRAQAWIRKVFTTYREWGVRYYMIDFLNAGAGAIGPHVYDSHHDQQLVAGPEAYQSFLRVIREACGDDTYLLSSSGPMVHNAGIVDAIRTGNDFGEGRQISPDSFFYPASFVINSSGFWTGPLFALRNQACSYYTHRKLYINDSGNVLTVDSPLPLEDARLHATIHTLGGSPAMVGDDIDRMAPDRLDILRKTFPRPRDVAKPLDLFDTPHPDHPHLFHRHIATAWGQYHVLAVYNFGAHELRQDIAWEQLGVDPEQQLAVWEFWNQQYVGTFSGSVEAVVPAASVRVYRLTGDAARPGLLGTDMHILMGEMEVRRCQWDADSMTLFGHAWRPGTEVGHVFLRAPAGLAVVDPRELWVAKDARDNSLVIKKRLDFAREDNGWSVQFKHIQ